LVVWCWDEWVELWGRPRRLLSWPNGTRVFGIRREVRDAALTGVEAAPPAMGVIDGSFVEGSVDDDVVCAICQEILDQPHSCCSQGHCF